MGGRAGVPDMPVRLWRQESVVRTRETGACDLWQDNKRGYLRQLGGEPCVRKQWGRKHRWRTHIQEGFAVGIFQWDYQEIPKGGFSFEQCKAWCDSKGGKCCTLTRSSKSDEYSCNAASGAKSENSQADGKIRNSSFKLPSICCGDEMRSFLTCPSESEMAS